MYRSAGAIRKTLVLHLRPFEQDIKHPPLSISVRSRQQRNHRHIVGQELKSCILPPSSHGAPDERMIPQTVSKGFYQHHSPILSANMFNSNRVSCFAQTKHTTTTTLRYKREQKQCNLASSSLQCSALAETNNFPDTGDELKFRFAP